MANHKTLRGVMLLSTCWTQKMWGSIPTSYMDVCVFPGVLRVRELH